MRHFKMMYRMIVSQKLRNLFVLIGISLGAIIITSSQILIASIEESNEASVKELYGDLDMYVGYQLSLEDDPDQPLSADEVQRISSLDHVEDSTPMLYPYLGKEAEYNMWDTVYVGFNDEPLAYESTMVEIGEQRLPGPGEVIVSPQYANLHNIEVGDIIELPFPPGPNHKIKVVGLLEDFEYLNRVMIFNYDWLESVTQEGPTALMLKLDTYESKSKVESEILQQIDPALRVDTLDEADEHRENIGGMYPILTGLNVAVLIVSSLLLISILQISIQEKQQELAVFRILGASRRFLFGMTVFESAIIGGLALFVGSIVGFIVPVVILNQIDSLMNVPITDIAIPWRGLTTYVLIYALLILAAVTIPAYQASKAPPIEAYQTAVLQPVSKRMNSIYFVILIMASLVVSSISLIMNNWILHVVTIFMLLTLLIYGIPFFLKWGILGFLQLIDLFSNQRFYRIAPLNALRQIKRNTQIAAIVIASFSLAVLGYTTLDTVKRESIANMFNQKPSDLRIVQAAYGNYQFQADGFTEKLYEQLMEVEGVSEYSLFFTKSIFSKINNLPPESASNTMDETQEVLLRLTGTDLSKLFDHGAVIEGETNPSRIAADQAVITQAAAEYLGYHIGDVVELIVYEEGYDEPVQFEVASIIENLDILGEDSNVLLLTNTGNMEAWFSIKNHEELRVNVGDNVLEDVLSHIDQLILDLGLEGDLAIFDRYEALNEFVEQFNQRMFILLIAVLILITLSLVGIMNSSISSIKERLPEFSVLRVIGLSKKTQRYSLLFEGLIITTICGGVSLLLSLWISMHIGLSLGASSVSMPTTLIVLLLLLAPILGVIALLVPSMWASNKDILRHLK